MNVISIALIDKDTKSILIIKIDKNHKYLSDKWSFPSVKIEDNKIQFDTLKKEVFNRLNIDITSKKDYEFIYVGYSKRKINNVNIIKKLYSIEIDLSNYQNMRTSFYQKYKWIKRYEVFDYYLAKIDVLLAAKFINDLGWCGTLDEFLLLEKQDYMDYLYDQNLNLSYTSDKLSESQKTVWSTQYDALKNTFSKLAGNLESVLIVFEYELPGEAGKRAADVNILTSNEKLFVIDFKHKNSPTDNDLIKLNSDSNILKNFHSTSHNLDIYSYIALTINEDRILKRDSLGSNIIKVNKNNILEELIDNIKPNLNKKSNEYNVFKWLAGRYDRKPSILRGTVQMFLKNKDHMIWYDNNENISQSIKKIKTIYEDSKKTCENKFIVISGTPGSGKTLLGLSSVAIIQKEYENSNAIYFSGNGPLVGVLRYAIKKQSSKNNDSSSIIKTAYEIKDLIRRNQMDFDYIVFDESQRSWFDNDSSEIKILIEWLIKQKGAVIVFLVGKGQAIYNKELPFEEFKKHAQNLGHRVLKFHMDCYIGEMISYIMRQMVLKKTLLDNHLNEKVKNTQSQHIEYF